MLKDEDDFGSAAGEFGRTLHLAGENLKVESPTVICEPDDILLKLGVAGEVGLRREPVLRVGVPMQLHPHSAHAAIFSQAVALRSHVIDEKVGIADDGLRKAGLVGGVLYVGDFFLEGVFCPIGLHVNRCGDAATGDVGEIFADRIVAPHRLVRAEDARLHRPVEPRQIGSPPNVVMSVDDCRHAILRLRNMPAPTASNYDRGQRSSSV